ncbi:MAG: SDR family NAD(P)-dependent oxidoreductase [Clostridia bacterium]|nr:SDR family NAD(P)-dependent oxidoreductase [Clostridia bacterium]
MKQSWLYEKYVVVTGASSGIGRAVCKLLVEKYAVKVIGVGRNEANMRSLQAELSEANKKNFCYFLFDVGEKENWLAFYESLKEKQITPTMIVNNAGAFPPFSRFEKQGSEKIKDLLKVNFEGAVYASEVFLPVFRSMGERGGILNVSSSAALCPIVGTTAYSASKGALKGFTEALSLEYGKETYVGIVFPGTTATPLFEKNETLFKSGLLQKLACSPKKMAKKIVRVLIKRKRRATLGVDAKLMEFLYKIAPIKGPRLIRWVMKRFGGKYFNGVFEEKN